MPLKTGEVTRSASAAA